MVLVAGFALCAVQFPNFASTRVVANLLTDNAFLGIVATGMTFVIISGGIDLSVGSVIGFTTVFVALAIERLGVPPLLAFVAILRCRARLRRGDGRDHPRLRHAALHRDARRHVPRARRSFLISTESTPITAPIYCDRVRLRVALPGGGRLTAIALIMLAVVAAGAVLLHFTRVRRQRLCARRQPRHDRS